MKRLNAKCNSTLSCDIHSFTTGRWHEETSVATREVTWNIIPRVEYLNIWSKFLTCVGCYRLTELYISYPPSARTTGYPMTSTSGIWNWSSEAYFHILRFTSPGMIRQRVAYKLNRWRDLATDDYFRLVANVCSFILIISLARRLCTRSFPRGQVWFPYPKEPPRVIYL